MQRLLLVIVVVYCTQHVDGFWTNTKFNLRDYRQADDSLCEEAGDLAIELRDGFSKITHHVIHYQADFDQVAAFFYNETGIDLKNDAAVRENTCKLIGAKSISEIASIFNQSEYEVGFVFGHMIYAREKFREAGGVPLLRKIFHVFIDVQHFVKSQLDNYNPDDYNSFQGALEYLKEQITIQELEEFLASMIENYGNDFLLYIEGPHFENRKKSTYIIANNRIGCFADALLESASADDFAERLNIDIQLARHILGRVRGITRFSLYAPDGFTDFFTSVIDAIAFAENNHLFAVEDWERQSIP